MVKAFKTRSQTECFDKFSQFSHTDRLFPLKILLGRLHMYSTAMDKKISQIKKSPVYFREPSLHSKHSSEASQLKGN